MTSPADSANPPLAEPGKRPSGASVGGVSASAEPGVAHGARRSTEQADEAVVRAATGDAAGATRATAAEPGAAHSGRDDDDEDPWRHAPVAPVDERNPLRSLGNAIADTLTGSDADTPRQPPKR